MRKVKFITILIGLFLLPVTSFSQDVSNYLIMQNIGSYVRMVKVKDFRTLELKTIPGYTITNNSGVLMGTDHLFFDHDDKTYETVYESDVADLGVEVQVTQHAGVDSDKWLLHELDKDLRNYYGIPDESYSIRIINGNTIITFGDGGWDYRWLSGNKIINITYTDLQMTKPQPLEVVQAYLSKFPSSLPNITSADLRTSENKTKWIKDEMDRKLWLCDKWSMQLQLGKVTQADTLQALVKHMTAFLYYRQKYYGVSADKDLAALSTYLRANDGTSIKAKLTEYKTWWSANKSKSISL